jgi:choline monooxygenase
MALPQHFEIDPEVRRARTLPPAFYLDEAVFAAVRERVFAPSWQWLGPLADVAAPGTLSPRTLLPGLLDEPLLLARDAAGALRCLSNVCTHRGMLLVDQACTRSDIRCPYHSRRFDLQGRMSFMPGFEGAIDFPGPADHLPELPLRHFGGQTFAALKSPQIDFERWIAPVRDRIGWLPLDHYTHDPARDRDFLIDAHWALYVENYLEGLHIPFLHPGLNQTLDWSGYRYELFEAGNLQLGLARPGEPAFENLPSDSPDRGQPIAAYYFWLFPNLMLNFYPWGLSLNLIQPLAPAQTRVSFRAFVGDAAKLGQGAGSALDQVELEDEAAVQAVQRGLRSRLYRGGRYAPQHERGTHQFHRLLAAALQPETSP